jgi:Wax ester synthase-like Acyl-CoA acyltransferase domain
VGPLLTPLNAGEAFRGRVDTHRERHGSRPPERRERGALANTMQAAGAARACLSELTRTKRCEARTRWHMQAEPQGYSRQGGDGGRARFAENRPITSWSSTHRVIATTPLQETPFTALPGASALGRVAKRVGVDEPIHAPERMVAPKTSFNGRVFRPSALCLGQLELDDVKAVKNAHGCTVNDVVVSICAAPRAAGWSRTTSCRTSHSSRRSRPGAQRRAGWHLR